MIAKLNRFLKKLRSGKKGVTAIEYALIAALIAVAIIAAVTLVGSSLSTKFTDVSTAVNNAPGGNP